jgi:hypothetical protein
VCHLRLREVDLENVRLMDEEQREFPREIRVDVRDADGRLVRGALVQWTEDGSDRGCVDAQDGHATLQPVSANSIIEVSATYAGEVKTAKLAVTQSSWTFSFDTAHQSAAAGAPLHPVPGHPAPDQPTTVAPAPGPRTGTIIAALIGLVGTLTAAYWQYGHKAAPPDSVTLTVYVKDRADGKPVQLAEVRLERASGPQTRMADNGGAARFKVSRGVEDAQRLVANAAGYRDAVLALRPLQGDEGIDVLLDAKPAVDASAPPPVRASGSRYPPTGTWQVQMSGDPALRRVMSGTIAFSPQPDGVLLVSGSLSIDGIPTRIAGKAGQQGSQLFLDCDAEAGGQRWKAKGNLELRAADRMRGYIRDSQGQDLPLELKKP